ncbi:MAG: sugar ABC transporter ATP-binding protein [Christensenellales bacterium]|jgi:ribose transport system ATP-binding protein
MWKDPAALLYGSAAGQSTGRKCEVFVLQNNENDNVQNGCEDYLLNMLNVTMEFPGVLALDNVCFNLRRGEVHVLLGENGAGKSTLMKILSGAYKKTRGTIIYKGETIDIHDVHHAQELGIGIIYQELNLLHNLSVAENIYVGRQPKTKSGKIDWKRMYNDAANLLDELGVDLDPRAPVRDLGVGQQQMVEVAKAVSKNVDVLIMDEPTSSLTEKEIEQLFKLIKDLKAKGVGIIYISHRLEELERIGDRATVLRDGQYIETVVFDGKPDLDYLIKLMVGRDLAEKYPKQKVPIGDVVFEAKDVCSKKYNLKPCSFHVRSGEILGVAGLMGAGRTELMRVVTGADHMDSGKINLHGKEVRFRNFGDAVRNRLGFLTEDRKGQGLVLSFDVKTNITLAAREKVVKRGIIDLKLERSVGSQMVDALRIKTPNLRQRVNFLSGGNQQKVVLAKWLYMDCDVLIFDEPTRGIDVGAKVEIYNLMTELAKRGAAIIMVSSELPEVLGMSDRIIVMHEGKITGEMMREEADQEKILYCATGGR